MLSAILGGSVHAQCNFDVDANGQVDALTDGLMILRAALGMSGAPLTQGAIGPNANRQDPSDVLDFINSNQLTRYDLDGNGTFGAYTDALMILRYMFGLSGAAVTTGAIGGSATRPDWNSVNAFLSSGCNSCQDGIKDLSETDIDCGGGTCSACADTKACQLNADCVSKHCSGNACQTATCVDGIKNQDETAVDCGGATCPKCGVGLTCLADADCLTNACDALSHTCATGQCSDHKKDGAETDIDCGGGGGCPTCGLGLHCAINSDCISNACDASTLTCVSSQCNDHHQDGQESDIDCGGGICAACGTGKKCNSSLDCQVGHVCLSHICN